MSEQIISRRQLLAGGTSIMAGAAAALAGFNAFNGNRSALAAEDEQWDLECDVLVMGFGYAGASAAIGAAEAGAQVIVLEKAPEADCGGNSSVCGGGFVQTDPDNIETAVEFLRAQMPDTIEDEELEALATELISTAEWLTAHECDYVEFEMPGAMYSKVLESSIGFPLVGQGVGAGHGLYASVKAAVERTEGIEVMYETAGCKLVFDPATKEVFGMVALDAEGNPVRIKARRAVVMACGGFENNHRMLTSYYTPTVPIFAAGSPYNTGDGIEMVMEIGAELRGFSSAEWACHACRKGSEEMGTFLGLAFTDREIWNNAIMVNKDGKRFVGEASGTFPGGTQLRPLHDKTQLPELAFSMSPLGFKNLPMFMICDSTKAQAPMFNGCAEGAGENWAHLHGWYTWSADNQAEVEKGWVEKADTLEELAEKLGIDAEGLIAQVEAYNAACDAGVDEEFGRETALTKIETAPFYGTELGLGLINTQGGAVRDGEHHVKDTKGNVIPRLYSAGEFGSTYVFLYQGAGNIPEALAGRFAGANAAAEEPWA